MTKQKSASPKQVTVESYVDMFFRQCEIGHPQKPEQFWRTLKKRFGNDADVFGGCIEARERGLNVSPYALKNKTIEFANAVAAQFDAAKLRNVALWILRERLSLNCRVLEIGCDNGILLCLLACLHPEGRFTGIDPCGEAIEIARQRAHKLGLTNVEFHVAAIDADFLSRTEQKFDVALSVTVYHELLANGFFSANPGVMAPAKNTFSLQETDFDDAAGSPAPAMDVVRAVHELLADDGVFVSVERWRTPEETLRWIRLAEAAGLSVCLPKSFLIEYKNATSDTEVLPLTYLEKNKDRPPARACDVLSFKAYRDFLTMAGLCAIQDPVVAELMYGALEKADLYVQESVFHDGSGTERVHVGVANGLGFIYTTTTRNFRLLHMLPSALMSEKMAEIHKLRAVRAQHAGVSCRWGDRKLLAQLGIEADDEQLA